jgi:outer membrane autotransporter protein
VTFNSTGTGAGNNILNFNGTTAQTVSGNFVEATTVGTNTINVTNTAGVTFSGVVAADALNVTGVGASLTLNGATSAAALAVNNGTLTFGRAVTQTGAITMSNASNLNLGTYASTGAGAGSTFTSGAGASTITTTMTTSTTAGTLTTGGAATVPVTTSIRVIVPSTIAVTNGAVIPVILGTGGTAVVGGQTVTTNSAVISFATSTHVSSATPDLTGATSLYVIATRSSSGFSGVSGMATSTPSYSAGTALNSIAAAVPTAGTDMATVTNAFNSMTASELSAAIPKLAPQTAQATTGAAMSASSAGMGVVSSRMASLRGDSSVLANNATGVASGDVKGKAMWLRAFGTRNSQGTLSGYSGYNSNTTGFAVGGDVELEGDRTVGVAFTYASTKVDQTDASTGNTSRIMSYGQTIYGSQNFGRAYIDGMLGLSFHQSDNVRQAALSRIATSSTSAIEYGASISSGYRFALQDKLTVTPMIQYTLGQYKQQGYSEKGADALNLVVNQVNVNRSKVGVGFRITDERTSSTGMVFKPEFSAMLSQDLNDAAANTTAAFAGGGSTFYTPGQKVSKTSYDIGSGVVILQGKTGQVGLNYNFQKREAFTGHNLLLQGRMTF